MRRERLGSPLSCALLALAFDVRSVFLDHVSSCVHSSVRVLGTTTALGEGD